MNPKRHRLVTGDELWLQRAHGHGVRYDNARKSFDDIAQDNQASIGAYSELLAPDPRALTSANHQAAVNTAHARALPIEDAVGRRLGIELGFYVEPLRVLAPEGRIVPRRSTRDVDGEWESIAILAVAHQEVMRPHDFPTTGLRP